MREGRGLNDVSYAFLSFYEILETAFPKDAKRIEWISASIADLTGLGVKEALDGIRALGLSGTRSPKPRDISRAAGGYFPAHLRGTSENRW